MLIPTVNTTQPTHHFLSLLLSFNSRRRRRRRRQSLLCSRSSRNTTADISPTAFEALVSEQEQSLSGGESDETRHSSGFAVGTEHVGLYLRPG